MARQRVFLSLIAAFALVQSAAVPAGGQAANSATNQVAGTAAVIDPVMPTEPNAAMQLAARVSRLTSDNMQPWHLKANYQTFDANGKPKDTGVFEEWWAGAEKYKISYTSKSFNQIYCRNGEKRWVTGDEGLVPPREAMVAQYLVDPLPSEDVLAKEEYIPSKEKVGKVTLGCFKSTKKPSPTVCLAKELPAIRVEFSSDGLITLFNKIVQLDNHYVAEQVQVANSDLAIVDANVVTLEGLSKIDDGEFAPPASARISSVTDSGGTVTAGRWAAGFAPEYPSMAMASNIGGTVVLWATITKAGTMSDVEVISGPLILQRAALEAVKTWKYQPFTRNGQPVELRTRIDVVFRHGR